MRGLVRKGLGLSPADRKTHLLRLGFLAHLLTRNNGACVVAAIALYTRCRERNRAIISSYLGAYCSCPLEVCETRDHNGLCARARGAKPRGSLAPPRPYEPPPAPVIDRPTHRMSIESSVDRVLSSLAERGLIPAERVMPLEHALELEHARREHLSRCGLPDL